MKPPAFDYARPDTLDETLGLLAEFGPDATPLAGGMSLGAMLNMRLVRPGIVIDLNRVPGLDRIESRNDDVSTGARVCQAVAMKDSGLIEAIPMLGLALPYVGHYQTRNRGTLGGSVAHADPSAEIPLCLVACGGAVVLTSRKGSRAVAAADFFHGPLTTARTPDELITGLIWPRVAGAADGFAEIAQRHGDFAIAAAAARATVRDGSIVSLCFALGGIEDRPRAFDTSPFTGAPATPETADEISAQAAREVDPVADLQANADYRRHLAALLGARAISQAFDNV
jgi:2-furoyl-CoA dehydrogenase FAD binding subunit